MEGNKLEISGRVTSDPPPASYKPISESDTEGVTKKERPKSLTKSHSNGVEMDGADEQMLPKDNKNVEDSKIPMGDVQFTSNEKQNGEAKLDIGEIKSAFVGMGKEELMKYANDPFWIRLRWILFISFWLLWLAMLIGAIIIIVAAPKCAPPAPRTWWEQGPLTEVEVSASTEDLNDLKEQKIKGVIVRNLEDSYKPVNDSIELLNFIKRAHNVGVKVIVELQPTSTNLWFEQSEQKMEPYELYYIWANKKSANNGSGYPEPPNNWISPNGGSAWEFSKSRNQFYYAPNSKPHLNFRNQYVIDEFSNILRQWVEAGADGIQLRGAPQLLVDEKLEDEPPSSEPGYIHTDYAFYKHSHTVSVDGIGEVLKEWKDILRIHNENMGPLMIAEDLNALDAYIVNKTLSIDLPRHSAMFSNPARMSTAQKIYTGLNSAFAILQDYWPLWQYDSSVIPLSSDILNIITMLLPGCPLISNDTRVDPQLLQIRDVPSVMFGSYHTELLAQGSVFAYLRVASGNPGYLVACNPSETQVFVNFTAMRNVSEEVTIQVLSNNYSVPEMMPSLKIKSHNVNMPPKSAIVLTYVPKST